MAGVGAWDVPAGTEKSLKIRRKDISVKAGAVEHKNRPEAVYIVISAWVKPKLALTKARALGTSHPEELAIQVSMDFEKEVNRFGKKIGSCFDSNVFDQSSIIWDLDYAPQQSTITKRQYMELELNIDTSNTIGMDNLPSPNPQTGKIEMYSFKDIEKHIIRAVDKVLSLDPFEESKSFVSFATKKGAK